MEYLQRVVSGTLATVEQRDIGLPWSPAMVERSRRSSGATLAACRAALNDGVAVNLAGGTHHAYRDHGEGFCVFNDSAIAALSLLSEQAVDSVVILDCDVHQGNGTAVILNEEPRAFTFSIHGANNYPFAKERSDLDIELPDGTTDADYLTALQFGLAEVFRRIQPDLAIYLAGVDPHVDDRLGRLALSSAGLLERDQMVFAACRSRGIPVALTMAGGYGPDPGVTARLHLQTVCVAAYHAGLGWRAGPPAPQSARVDR